MTQKHKQTRGLKHHLPHRTRYRVSPKHKDEEKLRRIHDSLVLLPGVKSVEINDRTGSVLVHHEAKDDILDSLEGALAGIGEDIFEEVLGSGIDEFMPGGSIIAHLIKQRIGRFDSFVAELTDNLVDLKMLLPIFFLGAGVFQATRNRNWFGQVPAWVLFYYAYDSYLKFHGPQVSRFEVAKAGGNGPLPKRKGVVSE